MSGTGDTGQQELPGNLPEKDEATSDTGDKQESLKEAEMKQESNTNADETNKPTAEANETQAMATDADDFHLSATTTDKKHESATVSDEKLESAKATEENLKSTIAASEKTPSATSANDSTTDADESQESAKDHNVKDESTIDTHEKQEPVATANEKQEPVASAGEKQEPVASADEKQEPVASANDKQEPVATSDEKRAPVFSAVEKQKPTAMADETKAPIVSADEKLKPTTMADEQQAPVASADEKQESAAFGDVGPVSTTVADEKPDSTTAADEKPDSTTVAEKKPDSTAVANKKPDSTSDADKKPVSTTVADEKPKEEEEFLDILGNGTLLKKILEAGSGDRPNMGDVVNIHMSQEIPELDKVLPDEQLQYVLGDGDVVQALDLAVALMKIGEKSQVLAGYKYMYGDLGLEPDIPPKSNFKLTVKLLSSDGPLDFPKMDFKTRFAEAKKKKERGNFYFKRKLYDLALNSYKKASRILDPGLGCMFTEESAEKLQQLLEFRAIVLCNTSAAQFKMEAYESAVKAATDATSLLPSYHKAYVRLGQAQEKLGNSEQTIKSYKQALKNDADNSKWLHGELERLTKLNKQTKKTQQEMYSKMFWGANPPSMKEKAAMERDASLFLNADEPWSSCTFDYELGSRRMEELAWQFVKNHLILHVVRVIHRKVLAGEMPDEIAVSIGSYYCRKFDNNDVELNPSELLALSAELSTLLPTHSLKLLQERSKYLHALSELSESEDKGGGGTIERCEKAMDKSDKGKHQDDLEKQKLPSPAAVEKAEPKSTIVVEPVKCPHVPANSTIVVEPVKCPHVPANSTIVVEPVKCPHVPANSTIVVEPVKCPHVPANKIFNEGTDVDTGITASVDTPPNHVLEVKALGSAEKKQPQKKSSWLWRTGATVMGAGLVGLAGIGLYKYMNH